MTGLIPSYAVEASSQTKDSVAYSVCTLVSKPALYAQMVESFHAAGFTVADCEYLYVDNTKGNQADGYQGLNRLIAKARGTYVILCHQDVIAIDGRHNLDNCLAELTISAPDWGVVGNAGYSADRKKRFRLTDRHRYDDRIGNLPGKVASLDENFLLIRRDALLGFSHDLDGFHLYGTDLVTQAALRGRTAWVVDFHLEHLGVGTIDATFENCVVGFQAKYQRAMAHRAVRTPVTMVDLGRASLESRFRLYKLRLELQGRKPFAMFRPLTKWLEALPHSIYEWRNGSKYTLDGTTFTLPTKSPLLARKAMRRGFYEAPEREMVKKWLPRNMPAIEIGGAYGVVSHTIRAHVDTNFPVIVVEANPALVQTCRANAALAKGPLSVVGAALSFDGAETVRFSITDALHTSHITKDDEAEGTVLVPALTLGQILASEGVQREFSLVCDIEGAEFDLLLNDAASLKQCACIIMEIHPEAFMNRGHSVSAFLALLKEAGFAVVDKAASVIVAHRIASA